MQTLLNKLTRLSYVDREVRTDNSTYKKLAVQCSADPEVSGWLIKHWFSASIPYIRDAKNRHLRQAAKRQVVKKLPCIDQIFGYLSDKNFIYTILKGSVLVYSHSDVMRHYKKQTDNDEHTNFNSKHFDTFGFLHPYIYGGQRIETNKTKL